MQFPHSSNNDSASDSSGSPRIEPTIGESKPAPWDVKPEAAPAFELVEEPKEDWGAATEPTADESVPSETEPALNREEPVFYEPGSEPDEVPLPDLQEAVAEKESELPGLTESHEAETPEPLIIPTAESVSTTRPSLTEEPPTVEAVQPNSSPVVETVSDAAMTETEMKKRPGFFAFMKKGADEARAQEPQEESAAPTEEQLVAREKTRNRLIGAAAILMAVVVSSSFILDNEELVKGEASVSTAIPPVPDKASIEKPVLHAKAVSPKSEPVKVEAPKVVNAAQVKQSPSKADVQKEKKVDKKVAVKPEKKADKKATPKGFFIQIVVTSSEQKAQRMVHDLKRLKLPAYSEQIKGKKGPLWRVRIGHFKTEKEAKNTVAVLALNGYTGKHYIDKQ